MSENPKGQKIQGKSEPRLKNRFLIFSIIMLAIIIVIGSIAYVFSMRQFIRTNKGNELSQLIEIERMRLETSVNAEITIVLKMANSPLIQQYFMDPTDPLLEAAAFREIASYREAFKSQSVFWVNSTDFMFHSDDEVSFTLDPDDPANYWFYMTMYETEVYNFNINYNPDLNNLNLWINAPVFDPDGAPVGILGTGIELTGFINTIYQNVDPQTNLYFFNSAGEIT